MSIYHSQENYHYTYLITVNHQITNEPRKYYIGVRSCKCLPEEDIRYIGSSKHLKKFLKEHAESIFHKTIYAYFMTREDANAHEIQLHTEFDVASNTVYFNRSKHTSTGFCRSGTTQSEETKQKLRCRFFSEEHKQKISAATKGRTKSAEHKQKIREFCKRRTWSDNTKHKISASNKKITKVICRISDRKEYRLCDVSRWGLEKLCLTSN